MKLNMLMSLIGLISQANAQKLASLPPLRANSNSVTMSGFSAGGFMTDQMVVAFSDIIKGGGMIAGGSNQVLESVYGPYQHNNLDFKSFYAEINSVSNPFSVSQLSNMAVEKLKLKYSRNQIDDPINLKHKPVFVGIDTEDKIVNPKFQYAQKDFFQNVGANVLFEEFDEGHNFLGKEEGPDMVGKILSHTLTNIDASGISQLLPLSLDWEKYGNYFKFNQSEFIDPSWTLTQVQMTEEGYIYVPHSCQKGGCNLHVSLHGCQGRSKGAVMNYFTSDYLKYAASNDLIILFPTNLSCWDVFGYTNEQYSLKTGVQPQAIIKMVNKVLSNKQN